MTTHDPQRDPSETDAQPSRHDGELVERIAEAIRQQGHPGARPLPWAFHERQARAALDAILTTHAVVKLPTRPSEYWGPDHQPQWNHFPFTRVDGDEVEVGARCEHVVSDQRPWGADLRRRHHRRRPCRRVRYRHTRNRGNEMTDIVERAKAMITTIEYARFHGIAQAYPDSIVKDITAELVAEVERKSAQLAEWRAQYNDINESHERVITANEKLIREVERLRLQLRDAQSCAAHNASVVQELGRRDR